MTQASSPANGKASSPVEGKASSPVKGKASSPVRRIAPFLFSVDLEDIRTMFEGGERYPERVPENAERFLSFLDEVGARCTFFVVGDVARRYPDLVRRIDAAGHEVACHGGEHVPLDRLDADGLREDLRRARDLLAAAGVERVTGYRAPCGSIVRETSWAYDVLREQGFLYSSSVIAAPNPIYGWPEFGPDRPRRENGIWELPMSLTRLPGLRVPFVGGVYCRVLPYAVVRSHFRRRLAIGDPVVGYIHAHDIDAEQDRFMHPEIGGNRFFNWLMYRNRAGALRRIEKLLALGAAIVPYRDYVESLSPGDGEA